MTVRISHCMFEAENEWKAHVESNFCFTALEDDEGKNNDGISFSSMTGPTWAGTERDYTYDEVGPLSQHTQQCYFNIILYMKDSLFVLEYVI